MYISFKDKIKSYGVARASDHYIVHGPVFVLKVGFKLKWQVHLNLLKMPLFGSHKLIYSINPYPRTKKLRTLRLRFSVMHHLNQNLLQREYE